MDKNEARDFVRSELKGHGKLLHIGLMGSKLYGTDTEDSDTDYFGIYLPSLHDVFSGEAKEVITFNTNGNNTKNGKDDCDIVVYSITKFYKLLQEGNFDSLEKLYSVLKPHVIRHSIIDYIDPKEYIGSVLGYVNNLKVQSALKAEKIRELSLLSVKMENFEKYVPLNEIERIKLKEFIDSFIDFETYGFNHIRKVEVRGVEGIEILGKKYLGDIKYGVFSNVVFDLMKGLTKNNRNSYNHQKEKYNMIRSMSELLTLIETGDLKFPIKHAEYLKKIKVGDPKISKLQLKEDMDYLIMRLKEYKVDKTENQELKIKMSEVIQYLYNSYDDIKE